MNHSKETVELYNKIALAYQDRFMDDNLYNDSYDLFCQLIQKTDATILELACGPGNITRYLLTKRPNFKILATDLAPNMLKLAKKNVPNSTFKLMDCRDLKQADGQFDAIFGGFVLPYLSDSESSKLFKDCASKLSSAGLIYFSTIEGDYNLSGYETGSNGIDRVYVYYYQKEDLLAKMAVAGFECLELISKNFTKGNGAKSTHLILIARKK